MSKKTLILISCLVLSLTIGLGGSLAYLTDTDTKVNTFTMGNVDIKVEENFDEDDNGYESFMPGIDIKKEAWIENVGDNEAFVWMTVAWPLALEGVQGENGEYDTADSSRNIVHVNTTGAFWHGLQNDQNWIDKAEAAGIEILSGEPNYPVAEAHTWIVDPDWAPGQVIDIEGEQYYVETRLYNSAIVPGEKTNYGISKVYLDTHVDYDPIENRYKWIENGDVFPIEYDLSDVDIYVTGYAIQAEGFDDVREAYEAFMGQWGELDQDMILAGTGTPVTDEASLRAALEKSNSVTLANDIELSQPLVFDKPGDYRIELNGKTLSRTFDVPQGDAVAVIKVNNTETKLEIAWGEIDATYCTGVLASKGHVVLNGLNFSDYRYAVVARAASTVEVHGGTDFSNPGWPCSVAEPDDLILVCANMRVGSVNEIDNMLDAITQHVARDENGNANKVFYEKWDHDENTDNDEGGVLHIVDNPNDVPSNWEEKQLPVWPEPNP